ncbi:MAG: GerMN domain-containing protein [Oscillatoriophycideae cyanobacterium NC_groundwater_1537_Pr4_S-0.65um_50_18]|nr:GerMN domain-containing protein [Oscillatoriophycideae cyanobacterium NC_groundwater_1537_Pr4_S-0.65um_50_18]
MRDHPSASDPKSPRSPKSTRFLPLGLLVGLSTVALTAGAGVAWWTWHNSPAPISSTPTTESSTLGGSPGSQVITPEAASPQTSSPETASPQAIDQKTVQVYWLKNISDQIEVAAAPVNLDAQQQPSQMLEAAFEQVLQKPTDPDLISAIPAQTRLRKLEVKPDGVHVDLSPEFVSGGGSTSMTGRLGQVIYTATTLDPAAEVWISVEGQPLEVLGGEGLIIDQPMTRESFEQNFQL